QPKFNDPREDIDKNSNHKKQILDICQVIIFISQYSTQLRLDKQESYATTTESLPPVLLVEESLVKLCCEGRVGQNLTFCRSMLSYQDALLC
ncbi:MAG: hypothetical protein ACKPBT_07705, partial [Microcystis aeruginosa]